MSTTTLALAEQPYEAQPSGLNINDVIFILCRHKWKIGAARFVEEPGAAATNAAAALSIVRGLEVTVVKGSNILSVAYHNKDPKLAREVLEELVKRYFDKHLEIHRSLGAFDFVSRET